MLDVDKIAKEIVEVAIPVVDPNWIMGPGVSAGQAEEAGKKYGEFYKGVLLEVVEAAKAIGLWAE